MIEGYGMTNHDMFTKAMEAHRGITGGVLEAGMPLFPRRKKYSARVGTLLPEGQVEIDRKAYASPSDAASAIAGTRTNGWAFLVTDQSSKRSLRAVRGDYINVDIIADMIIMVTYTGSLCRDH